MSGDEGWGGGYVAVTQGTYSSLIGWWWDRSQRPGTLCLRSSSSFSICRGKGNICKTTQEIGIKYWQRMRCLDNITDSMDKGLSKLQEMMGKPGALQSLGSQSWRGLSGWLSDQQQLLSRYFWEDLKQRMWEKSLLGRPHRVLLRYSMNCLLKMDYLTIERIE